MRPSCFATGKGRLSLLTCLLASTAAAQVPAPKLVTDNGRHALLVDGAPYLILGGQINNSSSWPAVLPQVWPALEAMHANTAEAPVSWEQVEPREGTYDWTNVDALVDGARAHRLHLILLWLATWKNGNNHYVPAWVKQDRARFPRVRNQWGAELDVMAARGAATLNADRTAFAALMRHLRERDGNEHTVLMVQVENESGSIGTVRDFSPESDAAIAGPVPPELTQALHKPQGTWRQVFGGDADEAFAAYAIARYINAVAEAGKREFPLPLYCNVWVQYPPGELPERHIPIPGIGYPAGGPVQTMLALWKAAAPAVDMIGPDIYASNPDFAVQLMDTYSRPDNPLWIPESGLEDAYAPLVFVALGRGAIGWSPFGVDWTGWSTLAPGGVEKAFAENNALLGSMDRTVAALNYQDKLRTLVEAEGGADQSVTFGASDRPLGSRVRGKLTKVLPLGAMPPTPPSLGDTNPLSLANATVSRDDVDGITNLADENGAWIVEARFGFPQPDGRPAPGTKEHLGRALVAQLGPNEFLLSGIDAAVFLHRPGYLPGIGMEIVSAEEGFFTPGAKPGDPEVWHRTRLLNGDQTDRGIQFPERFAEAAAKGGPVAVKLTVARL